MSEHISKQILEKYGNREVDSADRLKTVLHLSKCEICFKEYQMIFPNQTNPDQDVSLVLNEADIFHLDFQEHLQPFVDNEISEVDRVIVESHIKNCDSCAGSLRDLQEFGNTLRLQKIVDEQAKHESIWKRFSAIFSEYKKPLALAFGLLIALGLGLFLIFRTAQPLENDVTKTLPSNISTPNSVNSEPINSSPTPNISSNIEPKATNVNQNLPKNETKDEPQNSNKDTNNAVEIKPQEIELAELRLPKYLEDLKTKPEILRGTNDRIAEKLLIISPNGKVIRESSPMLDFGKIQGVESYEISIYNDSNQLKKETIFSNPWRVPMNLPKGKLYEWQVSAKSGEKNYLGQGKFYLVSQADENKIRSAKDSLQRGKAFAEAGLIDVAKREFQNYLKQNPNSQSVKKLIQQLTINN